MTPALRALSRLLLSLSFTMSIVACSELEVGETTTSETAPVEDATAVEGGPESDGLAMDTMGPRNPGGSKDASENDASSENVDAPQEDVSDDEDGEEEQDTTEPEEDVVSVMDTLFPGDGMDDDSEESDVLLPGDGESTDTNLGQEDVLDEDTEEEDALEDVGEDVEEEDVEEEPIVIFSDPIPVSEPYGYGEGWLYSLTVNNQGRVGVLWSGSEEVPFGQSAPPQKLLFSQSDNDVTQFEAPILIAEDISPGDNEGDVMEGESSILFTWKGVTDSGTTVVFRKAVDASMAGTDLVVATASGSETLYRPYFIEKSLLEFCIAYQRTVSGSARVELSCSNDGGDTFQGPKQVNPANLSAYVSSGLYDGTGRLVMAYHGHEFGNTGSNKVYSQWSDNNGDSFSSPVVLSASAPTGTHVGPSLAMNSSTVYGAWERGQGGAYDAWFTSSSDGETWLSPESLPGMEMSVQLRAGKDDVVYATSKIADINPLLAMAGFVRSGDGGATWGELHPIETVADGYILDHDIVANRQKSLLHMVWWQYYEGSLQDQSFYVMTIQDQDAQ